MTHTEAQCIAEQRRPLREIIAKVMAHRSVGDPHALDATGKPRWLWFVEDADSFLTVFSSECRHVINADEAIAAEKARADAAEARIPELEQAVAYESGDPMALNAHKQLFSKNRELRSTISTLTAERDALIRERDEARAASSGVDGEAVAKPDDTEQQRPEWIWYCESTSGVPVVTFGRWAKHPQQARYKLAEIQPTEHDHPAPTPAGDGLQAAVNKWAAAATAYNDHNSRDLRHALDAAEEALMSLASPAPQTETSK